MMRVGGLHSIRRPYSQTVCLPTGLYISIYSVFHSFLGKASDVTLMGVLALHKCMIA